MGAVCLCKAILRPGTAGLAVVVACFAPIHAVADQVSSDTQVWNTSYQVERESSGLKLASTNGAVAQSLEISGANAGTDASETLKAGESWRKAFQVDAKSRAGTLFSSEFRSNFTETWRDPGDTLTNLQAMGESGGGSRALTDLYFKMNLFDDRVSVSSESKASTWAPIDDYRDAKRGVSQQLRFNATVLQTDSAKLSVNGISSRVDPNYWELTDAPVTDPLLTRNRTTSQLGSAFSWDRIAVSAFERETEILQPNSPGAFRARQSLTGGGASVSLSDFRTGSSGLFGAALQIAVPDSIWVSESQGLLTTGASNLTPDGSAQNYSFGTTRNWDTGDVSLSYWQSANRIAQFHDSSDWTGHGIDLGGNLYFGHWKIYGGVSVYSSDNAQLWNNGVENSFSGTLLASWKPSHGPAVTAGVISYRYGYDMLDYAGFTGTDLRRYEVALDLSSPLSEALHHDMHLKFMASYRANAQEWRWENSGYDQGLGNVFAGFRFELPLRP